MWISNIDPINTLPIDESQKIVNRNDIDAFYEQNRNTVTTPPSTIYREIARAFTSTQTGSITLPNTMEDIRNMYKFMLIWANLSTNVSWTIYNKPSTVLINLVDFVPNSYADIIMTTWASQSTFWSIRYTYATNTSTTITYSVNNIWNTSSFYIICR